MKRKLPDKVFLSALKIDIGCGNSKQQGYVGIDRRDCGQEIIWDIKDGIPLPDNSVEVVYSSHLLEHFDNVEIKDVLREIYRVLKKGGISQNIMPHVEDPTAFYVDHKSFWNEERVSTLTGIKGLEGFELMLNKMMTRPVVLMGKEREFKELLFELKKL
jgi:predicted SAM-dependent methyltransferase